ncbi:MAG TPA: hypothetical protein VJQ82_21700 [Terriglobales bacterium]|nr:hypothetical protein [Terriglobales bacterium]
MNPLAWVWFSVAQLLMLVLSVAGWVILILPCLLQAWEPSPTPSIATTPWLPSNRPIDRWKCIWLNSVYGNPEDGVSGQAAIVWGSGAQAGTLVPFMPNAWAPWRAWVWSAWRNSTDQLKYTLALGLHGPTFAVNVLGKTLRGGWGVENNLPVLVLSWKR